MVIFDKFGSDFADDLMNQSFSCVWLADVRSYWLFIEFLGEDRNNAVENTRWHEEVLKLIFCFSFVAIYILQKCQRKILLDTGILKLVC